MRAIAVPSARLLVLAALFVAGALLSPVDRDGANVFLSVGNQGDVLRQVSSVGILAVGMTLVVLTGGIDLAVGSTVGLGSTVTARLLMEPGPHAVRWASVCAIAAAAGLVAMLLGERFRRGRGRSGSLRAAPGVVVGAVAFFVLAARRHGDAGLLVPLLAAPAAGAIAGACSGLLVAKGRLQPFIATLAMMVAVFGLARLLADRDRMVHPIYFGEGQAPESFRLLRERLFEFLPVPGLVFLGGTLLAACVLAFTRFGRHVYAVGGNEEAARLAGVPVDRVKVVVYAASGLLAGLTGVLYAAQYTQGKPDAGSGLELDAIAAVVIGGTSLRGGRGSVGGTLVGVLLFGLLNNVLLLQNVDSSHQLVLKGLLIVGAVLLQEGSPGAFARRPFRPRIAP